MHVLTERWEPYDVPAAGRSKDFNVYESGTLVIKLLLCATLQDYK